MSFWTTPAGRAGLEARAMERGPLHEALHELPSCSRCERPSDDLLDRGHGERVCGGCRERERERFEAATGECWHGCGYDLRWHDQPRSIGDACPSEAEARERSGAQ